MRSTERLVAVIERLPNWLRPAFVGALILFAIVSIRILFAIPRLISSPVEVTDLFVTIGAASGAGAVGGLAYSLIGAPLRGLRGVGPYLTGTVTMVGYMGALALAAPYVFDTRLIETRSDLIIFTIVTLFFGFVMGHSWFRDG